MTELGTVLDGKYEILKQVGKGGMSIVYLAMDNRLNKQWAVKEIKNDGSKSTETLLKGLEREANILKNVDHPVLPRIVDIINENGTIYVIMDFVEGKPLSDVLKTEGAQSQRDVIEWGRALASALDYLHSMNPPIIYRDMKPSNVMLKPDGSVKLIDFGTAKEYIIENNADTTALGTRGYAAPEQFGDAQGHGIYNTDARTDIYNLGATLYHLVTGKNPCEPPYEIKPIRQWNPALSSGLEQIIIKCCQPNPNDRYQSCSELLYALDHYNELDNTYKAKAKRKIIAFAVTAGLSLVSVGVAVTGGLQKRALKYKNYDNLIKQAANTTDVNEAIDYYKQAVDIDDSKSEAYIGLLDEYNIYYKPAEDENENAGSELGAKYVLSHIDAVDDEVKYELALTYYNYLEDYKTASTYFKEVKNSNGDDAEVAGYYAAICDNKLKTNASYDDEADSIAAFEKYNYNQVDRGNKNRYINYYNIASIYVDNMTDNTELANKVIQMLAGDAGENIDGAINELNDNPKAFDEVNKKYYLCQYYRFLADAYEVLEDYTNEAIMCENYIYAIEDSIIDGSAKDSDKKAYASYSNKEASAYTKVGNDSKAADVYSKAEQTLGSDGYAASVYVAHLNFLCTKYKSEYGTNPATWKGRDGEKAVKAVYEAGNKIESLRSKSNTQWNSLINDSVIAEIIAN